MRDQEIMTLPGLREALLNPDSGTNALIVDFILHPFDGPFWRGHSAHDDQATIPAYPIPVSSIGVFESAAPDGSAPRACPGDESRRAAPLAARAPLVLIPVRARHGRPHQRHRLVLWQLTAQVPVEVVKVPLTALPWNVPPNFTLSAPFTCSFLSTKPFVVVTTAL